MTPKLSQREISVTSPLGEDVLLFRQMSGTEQLGRLFEFEVDLLSEDHDIQLEQVLGHNLTVSLALADGGKRHFNGFASKFCYVGVHGGYAHYKAMLRPWLWFLTRNAGCRIFQAKTVPEIVDEVFREHGFTDFEARLHGTYRTWDYNVQYRETDFAFVSRLMEQEGIYYYFRHEDGKHTLVLSDSYSAHDRIPGYEEIAYYPPGDAEHRDSEHISDWKVAQEIQPGRFAVADYDFERPKAQLEVRLVSPREHPFADFERYDYPGEYGTKEEGEAYVQVHKEELAAQFEQAEGGANARGLIAGGLFELSHFPRRDQNREYLLVSVAHTLRSDAYESSAEANAAPVYACRFTALDSKTPYRSPRTTPHPRIKGPQTAVVVGKEGEQVWTDKYGRVKVQFHWDREGQNDENSSCWVRVSQHWAGKNWGGMNLPHVGQEVIVDFLEGDPDHPIITGRVYNADNMPPLKLPENKYKSVVARDHYGNEIVFDGTPGDEHIMVHSPHHRSILNVGRSIEHFSESDQSSAFVGNSGRAQFGNEFEARLGWGAFAEVGGSASFTLGPKFEVNLGPSYEFEPVSPKYQILWDDYVLQTKDKLSISSNKSPDPSLGEKILGGFQSPESPLGSAILDLEGNSATLSVGKHIEHRDKWDTWGARFFMFDFAALLALTLASEIPSPDKDNATGSDSWSKINIGAGLVLALAQWIVAFHLARSSKDQVPRHKEGEAQSALELDGQKASLNAEVEVNVGTNTKLLNLGGRKGLMKLQGRMVDVTADKMITLG